MVFQNCYRTLTAVHLFFLSPIHNIHWGHLGFGGEVGVQINCLFLSIGYPPDQEKPYIDLRERKEIRILRWMQWMDYFLCGGSRCEFVNTRKEDETDTLLIRIWTASDTMLCIQHTVFLQLDRGAIWCLIGQWNVSRNSVKILLDPAPEIIVHNSVSLHFPAVLTLHISLDVLKDRIILGSRVTTYRGTARRAAWPALDCDLKEK